jgi:outer membrane protein assembly factor BamB
MGRHPTELDREATAGAHRRGGRWWALAAAIPALIALSAGPVAGLASGADVESRSAPGAVSVFASAPAPGHPFGIAVGDGHVYVSTSAGDFFADPENGGHQNSDGERVFTYNAAGHLVGTTVIPTMPNATMGLFGLALDGNPRPEHKLYVADMNGRILRVDLSNNHAAPELFSEVPASTGLAGDWMKAMWNDLAFDRAGNLYVPDDKPRIWRVDPSGNAAIWFTDPRLTGYFGFAGGPLGGRIDPTGKWLYFTITVSAEFPLDAVVYRVRLVDHPTADDLELVHRFPFDPSQAPPQATALAFAKSGNLYVSLIGPNQIAVLDPAGNEIRRISSPLFHSPWGLAFLGTSLLVTNADLEPADNPDAWKIFKVNVGEAGLPLIRPRS